MYIRLKKYRLMINCDEVRMIQIKTREHAMILDQLCKLCN